MEIVIVNFSLGGLSEPDYEQLCDEVAPAFAAAPGLVSKVWLADRADGVFGGVYTFESAPAVDAFLGSELFAAVARRLDWRTSRCGGSGCSSARQR